jgi:predicted CXXCH cytochrome family protein
LTPGTSAAPVSIPSVAPAHQTTRWLKQGSFNHSAHVASECTACHAAALKSEKASDVLIPGIATCQQCHTSSLTHKGAAGGTCLECHQYHNWNKEKDVRRTVAGL